MHKPVQGRAVPGGKCKIKASRDLWYGTFMSIMYYYNKVPYMILYHDTEHYHSSKEISCWLTKLRYKYIQNFKYHFIHNGPLTAGSFRFTEEVLVQFVFLLKHYI